MLMQTNITYPISKAVRRALAGGFVGALIMGGLPLVMPINGQPSFVATAMLMGLSGAMATAAGWMLHPITGLIVGTIFGVGITKVNAFRITNIKRGLAWGLGAPAWSMRGHSVLPKSHIAKIGRCRIRQDQ
jgi:hypothetical protein